MKVLCTRLLLSVAFLALCLPLAAPARAYEDTSQMSRAERLLLQDTVARLWTLHVGIGEKLPGDKAQRETFGLVKDEQISPAFVARLVLQLVDPDAGTQRLPPEMIATSEDLQGAAALYRLPSLYSSGGHGAGAPGLALRQGGPAQGRLHPAGRKGPVPRL